MNSLDYLQSLFPGQMGIPILSAGKIIGFAEQTTKNKVSQGKFPVQVGRIGKKRIVHILDLAEFMELQRAKENKIRRGRPTKTQQIERQQTAWFDLPQFFE